MFGHIRSELVVLFCFVARYQIVLDVKGSEDPFSVISYHVKYHMQIWYGFT